LKKTKGFEVFRLQ